MSTTVFFQMQEGYKIVRFSANKSLYLRELLRATKP